MLAPPDAGRSRRGRGRALAPLLLGTALVATAAPAHAASGASTTSTTPEPATFAGRAVATATTAAAVGPAPVFTPLNAAGLATTTTTLADWAPDGSRVAYVSGSVVSTVRANGSSPVTVSSSLNVNALSWSGRGARIALSGSEVGKAGDLPQLWITTPEGLKAYKVTAPGATGRRTTGVTWLDGVTLVVSYTSTGSTISRLSTVTLQDPAATSADLVPDDPSAALASTSLLDPAGSPDGRFVAYRQQMPDGAGGTVDSLWVVGRHGTGAHKIAEAARLGRPIWSADSRTVYAQQVGATTDVMAAPAAGGTAATALVTGVTAGSVLTRIPVAAGPTTYRRVTGRTSVETSITASRLVWPTIPAPRGATTAAAVVLVNQADWPSAVVAGPLAAVRQGPVLQTPANGAAGIGTELRRILAPKGTVYLVGSPTMLTPKLASAVTRMGYRAVRYTGADPYATAVAVAKSLGTPRTVVYASRGSWQDSMVASAAAGRLQSPVLFTAGTVQAPATAAYVRVLKPTVTWAVGAAAVKAAPTAKPVAGANPAMTALAAAGTFFLPASTAILADQTLPGDTVVAATTAARLQEPLLLSTPTALSVALKGYLDAGSGSVNQVWLFGRPTSPTNTVMLQAAVLGAGRIA